MLVKTIEEYGRKWEIYKNGENDYSFLYYEYFENIGWKYCFTENNYTKDAIEYELDVELD